MWTPPFLETSTVILAGPSPQHFSGRASCSWHKIRGLPLAYRKPFTDYDAMTDGPTPKPRFLGMTRMIRLASDILGRGQTMMLLANPKHSIHGWSPPIKIVFHGSAADLTAIPAVWACVADIRSRSRPCPGACFEIVKVTAEM